MCRACAGFAVVKKGRDKRTGEIVAIKVQSSFCIMLTVRALIFQYDGFRPQIWGGSEPLQVVDKWRYATEESSEREIRVLSKVGHMNCIKMHAVFVTARRVYIVTELVTGGELLDMYVGSHTFPIFLPICSPLQVLRSLPSPYQHEPVMTHSHSLTTCFMYDRWKAGPDRHVFAL